MTEHTHPQPVLWNWQQHHHERQRAEAIAANLPSYEQRVAETGKLLEELKAEYERRAFEAHQVIAQARADYATQGREHKLACDNAAMLYRIVAHECANLGLELPPEPAEVPPRPTEAIPVTGDGATRPQALPAGGDGRPVGVMAWQEVPAPNPLGGMPPGNEPLDGPLPPGSFTPTVDLGTKLFVTRDGGICSLDYTYRDRDGDTWVWNGQIMPSAYDPAGQVPGMRRADDEAVWAPWDFLETEHGPLKAEAAEDGDAPDLGRFQPGPAPEGETNG